jgi:hypothetical protein
VVSGAGVNEPEIRLHEDTLKNNFFVRSAISLVLIHDSPVRFSDRFTQRVEKRKKRESQTDWQCYRLFFPGQKVR